MEEGFEDLVKTITFSLTSFFCKNPSTLLKSLYSLIHFYLFVYLFLFI